MTGSFSRKLYQRFLSLYPEPFRNEFGDEMLSMFDEYKTAEGFCRLLADVVLSSARQWIQYISLPMPEAAPLYSEIALSPNLARILAITVFGTVLVAGVLVKGPQPDATKSWTMVRSEVRFWFPLLPWAQCSETAVFGSGKTAQ